jgi:hypothetical protein
MSYLLIQLSRSTPLERRRCRLLHAGRVGAHIYRRGLMVSLSLCQPVLAKHLDSSLRVSALPPKSHREPVLRPVPPTEPAPCILLPPAPRATTSPTVPPPVSLHLAHRPVPVLNPTPACALWPSTSPGCPCLQLATAPRCRDQGSWAAEVCFSLVLIGLPAAPQQDCSWPSPFSEPARSRSIYRQQVRRRPALRGVWLHSRSLFRLVLCVCVKLLAPPQPAPGCTALHRIHCFFYYTILYCPALPFT